MAETTVAPQSDASPEVKTPGNIVGRGKPTLAQPANVQPAAPENNEGAAAPAAATTAASPTETITPEINDDQLKELLKAKGIELDEKGIEGLKEKLAPAPAAAAPAPEPTAEEKAKAEAAMEKRMLDFFIANGGTAESFVAFKQIASTDLKSLSEAEIRHELKEAGFDEDEIKAVLTERYYQINPEELKWDEDGEESEEDFKKRKAAIEKKIAFGSKKLETKGSYRKKEAEAALNALREAIKLEDLQQEEEAKHSKRVEEVFTKIPRKFTFELGKAGENGPDIPPVEYELSDQDIADVQSVLSDPAKRKQFLYNEDNSLNVESLSKVMLRNKILEAALKNAYIKGDDLGSKREVEKFEKIFPGRTAKEIGVGGATGAGQNARKGHLVSRGKPEVVRP